MAKDVSREVGTSRNRKVNDSSSTPPNARIERELDTYAQGQLAKMYVGRPWFSGGVGEDLESILSF
jgi:hypothetical protein